MAADADRWRGRGGGDTYFGEMSSFYDGTIFLGPPRTCAGRSESPRVSHVAGLESREVSERNCSCCGRQVKSPCDGQNTNTGHATSR